jgi:hypothetical protein
MGKLCKLFQMFSRARRMEEARAVMLLVGYGERKTAGSLLTPGRLLGFRDEREICDKFAPPAEVTYDLDARIFATAGQSRQRSISLSRSPVPFLGWAITGSMVGP